MWFLTASSLLVVGTLAVLPGSLNRFVFAKAACVAAGAAIAVLLPARGRLPTWAVGLVAAGAAVLGAAAVQGAQPLVQLLGRGPRYEGLVMLAIYVAALAAGARLWGPQASSTDFKWLLWALAVGSIALASIALLEAAGLRPLPSTVARPGALLGNASDQGAWAVLAAAPLAAAAVRTRDRWAVVGAIAAAAAVVTSASRGALLGMVAGAAVLVVLTPAGRARMHLVAATAIAAAIALLLPDTRARLFGGNALADATVPGRELLWTESAALVSEAPWLGVGPSGFVDAITGQHTAQWYQRIGPAFPPDSPHAWPLQAAAAGGLLLLLLAVSFAAGIVWSAQRRRRSSPDQDTMVAGVLAGLVGYGVALLFHFTSPGPTALAALMAGMLIAVPVRQARKWLQAAAATALVGWSLLLTAAAIAEIPLRQAIERLQIEDFRSAEDSFRMAQMLRPWDVEVPLTAGHAYAVLAVEGYPEAIQLGQQWTRQASRWLSVSAPLLLDKASLAEAAGDLELATQHADAALALDANNPDLLMARGILHAKRGDYLRAEADFASAAERAPESPAPWDNLAALYRLQDRPTEAAEAQEQADVRR